MKLAAHIVTTGRLRWFAPCLKSVLRELPPESKCFVSANGCDEETLTFLKSQSDSRLEIWRGPRVSLAVARNEALARADADILYFLDDDIELPEGFFGRVRTVFRDHPELMVIGGPNYSHPEASPLETAFGLVMGSSFVAPSVSLRYSLAKTERSLSEHHLMFCNMGIRLKALRTQVDFDESLRSNEENLFVSRMIAEGHRVGSFGSLFLYHRRRDKLSDFVSQVASYGFGRSQQFLIAPETCSSLFFVPLVSLCFGLLLFVLGKWGLLAWLFTLYLGMACVHAYFFEKRKLSPENQLLVLLFTPLVHLSYGVGMGRGFLIATRKACLGLLGKVAARVRPPEVQPLKSFKPR